MARHVLLSAVLVLAIGSAAEAQKPFAAAGCYRAERSDDFMPDTLRLLTNRFGGLDYHRTNSFRTSWEAFPPARIKPIWNTRPADSLEVEFDAGYPILVGVPLRRMRLHVFTDSLVGVYERYRLVAQTKDPAAGWQLRDSIELVRPVVWKRVSCESLPEEPELSAKPSNDAW